MNRHVLLTITSNDVIHSFWVPSMGQKRMQSPGQNNKLVVTPDRIGSYPIICTELCGLGHAYMRNKAIVMSAGRLRSLVQGQRCGNTAGRGGGGTSRGDLHPRAVCGACHAFRRFRGRSARSGRRSTS